MQGSLLFLVKSIADLYLATFLLRFILQWVRADYRNQFAQFIVTVTNPLVVPARRIVPSAGGIDLPTLVVLFVLEIGVTWVLFRLLPQSVPIATLLLVALLRLVSLTVGFYTIAVLIYAILSWFTDRSYNPMAAILSQVVEPILRPVRRILPAVAGIDLSSLLVFLVLQAALIALRGQLGFLS